MMIHDAINLFPRTAGTNADFHEVCLLICEDESATRSLGCMYDHEDFNKQRKISPSLPLSLNVLSKVLDVVISELQTVHFGSTRFCLQFAKIKEVERRTRFYLRGFLPK